MITINRFLELINQGATIYASGYGEIKLIPETNLALYENGDYGYILYVLEPNKKYKNEIFDEELFETEEDAEDYLEFGNIERTEKFPFVPYTEFIKFNNIIFESKNNASMELARCFNPKGEGDWTIILTNRDDKSICYFEKPLSQENYRRALRVCRKLFLGD